MLNIDSLNTEFIIHHNSNNNDRLAMFGNFATQVLGIDLTLPVSEINLSIRQIIPKNLLQIDPGLCYLMTAFADEYFINASWSIAEPVTQENNEEKKSRHPNSQYWQENLLEAYFFNTHIAGDNFFRHIIDLIQQKNNPPLAKCYLLALSLGFRGKYIQNTPHNNDKIQYYYGLLKEYLNIPPATWHNKFISSGHKMIYLPNPNLWYLQFISIVTIILGSQWLLFRYFIGDIADLIWKF